jgi:phosphatidylethanolamine/phosphatidyl-N-methylethanolamine N-methyltransferase
MNEPFAIRERSRRRGTDQNQDRDNNLLRGLDLAEHVKFFQSFIREPASVGAISPSSRSLAKAMIQGCSLQTADTVVEIGPGTGAFTSLIRENIGRKTTFIALELDATHAKSLQRRFPDLKVYHDSAEKIRDYLELHGRQKANYIISGLPWASLPMDVQKRVMDAILACLAPGGSFTTFAYLHARWLPKARQFRQSLNQHFNKVAVSQVIWKNLPPAFVYYCARDSFRV